jgi:hypothetical protein
MKKTIKPVLLYCVICKRNHTPEKRKPLEGTKNRICDACLAEALATVTGPVTTVNQVE